MFRKILITIILICPIIFILMGYPTRITKQINEDHFAVSSRCFIAGDTKQFISCLKESKVNVVQMLKEITIDMNNEVQVMGYAFLIFLAVQIGLVYYVIKELEEKD